MERLTNAHGECLKCVGCIEQSNCDTECSAVDDCIEKLKIYEDLEEQGLLLLLPCRIGETVYVATNTLSVQEMEFEDEEVPKYITGRIISFKINSKEKTVKVGVRARWWKEWFDNETGQCGDFYEVERPKSYPLSAFGKTIFLSKKVADAALSEQENRE